MSGHGIAHVDGDRKQTQMRGRAVVVWVLMLPVISLAAACSSEDSRASAVDVSTIAVRNYEFEPEAISVEVGETVTWVWEGQAPHNVVGEGFESLAQRSRSFRHTFDQPGTYRFVCTIHPGMRGDVIVDQGSTYVQ